MLLLLAKLVVPLIAPQATPLGVAGGPVLSLAIAIWWLFFSRAPWRERVGAIFLIAVALFVASQFLDVSIATGMMGFMFPVFGIPIVALALVGWALTTRTLSDRSRRVALVVVIVLASFGWTLVRTGGSCLVGADRVVASCKLGKGDAIVVADADWLDMPRVDAIAGKHIRAEERLLVVLGGIPPVI